MTAQLSVQEKTGATLEALLDRQYNFYMELGVPFPFDLRHFPVSCLQMSTFVTPPITPTETLTEFQQWRHISVEEVDADKELLQPGKDLSETHSALVSFPEFSRSVMRNGNYSDSMICSMFETIRVSDRPGLCSMNVKKRSPFKEIFNIKYVCSVSKIQLHNMAVVMCSLSHQNDTTFGPRNTEPALQEAQAGYFAAVQLEAR